MNETAETVLSFWFGDLQPDGTAAPDVKAQWWKKDPAFDAEVREKFGRDIDAAERGDLDVWAETPRSALALVILCDQFTRNTRRDTAAMYAADPHALATARRAIALGHDEALQPMEAYFLYMPLMHAEDVEAQRECVERFQALAQKTSGPVREALEGAVGYARRHAEIVERFGRFPHRNEILARESTREELAFLQEPGSSF
jgi:uncharacterized protein (DUF924 family)